MKYALIQRLAAVFLFVQMVLACTKSDLILPDGIRKLVQGKDCTCEPYIDLYRWQGQQVFVLEMKGPACSWIPAYYQANGNTFTLPTGYDLNKFTTEAQFAATVWNCGQ